MDLALSKQEPQLGDHLEAAFRYAVLSVIFVVYGGKVCPFIDTLSLAELGVQTLIAFSLMFVARLAVVARYGVADFQNQPYLWFIIDFFLFIVMGMVYAIYNFIQHDFPMASGLKVIFGMIALGFYTGVERGISRQLFLVKHAKSHGITPQNQVLISVVGKFNTLIISSVTIATIISVMIIHKDLIWLESAATVGNIADLGQSILKEIIFAAAVVLGLTIQIIMKYGELLKAQLDQELNGLQRAIDGEYSEKISIPSDDEFGVIATKTNQLIREIETREEQLTQARDLTILALSSLAEARDNETGAHLKRTQFYVKCLAEYVMAQQIDGYAITEQDVELMFKSAPLHDIGKVGIADSILLKPGKLTDIEFSEMKKHTTIGGAAITNIIASNTNNEFLEYARDIVEFHHEKWDGSGYPKKLKADEIPLAARFMALADVYDALISKRVYKEAFSHGKAREIILAGKGKHFDPTIVDAFVACEGRFVEIAERFSD